MVVVVVVVVGVVVVVVVVVDVVAFVVATALVGVRAPRKEDFKNCSFQINHFCHHV